MNAVASSLRLLRAAWLLAGPARAFRAKRPDAGAQLSCALEKLGPAYIKLGQMLATRPDIVGTEMALALEHLQDRLPPFSETEARAEIVRAFGKPVEALFSSFGASLAAASIAQV
ncbi:MAG: ubiquinone biosynthesis protein UbiB, partial [Alphaproteobacteria bacterium]|nr:ubiquinone biosynthesis protein UbiB [Alphaproteobacteria bacterium]